MSSKPTVEITRLNDSVVMGWLGRVSIAVWRKSPEDMVDWFREEMRQGVERYGKGIAHMPVVEPGTPLFSPTIRKGLMQVMKDYEQEIDCAVAIFGGTGFAGGAMRAMTAGMILMLPSSRTKIKVAGEHKEAASHLMSFLPDHDPPLTATAVGEALATMRAAWAEANPKVAAG